MTNQSSSFDEKTVVAFFGKTLYSFRYILAMYYVCLAVFIVVGLAVFGVAFIEATASVFGYKMSLLSTGFKSIYIIKVLELVDMVMVVQLMYMTALAGFGLFVSQSYFNDDGKPDWLDHVTTYSLKTKLGGSIVSISGVHVLKLYLQNSVTEETLYAAAVHLSFVVALILLAVAEKILEKRTH